MILKTLDFSNIQTCEQLVEYVSKELNFAYVMKICGWDAYNELCSDALANTALPKDYVYSEDDDWEWNDYEEYLRYKNLFDTIGVRNEFGERDDIRLMLCNFHQFYLENQEVANQFLYSTIWSTSINGRWKGFKQEEIFRVEICIVN